MWRTLIAVGFIAAALIFGAVLLRATEPRTTSAPAVAAPASAPSRIVSLAPGITEILFALGVGDRVVGVTSHTFYPPEASQKPSMGDWLATNAERVVAQKPDLVLISSMERAMAEHLQGLGLPCTVVKQDSVSDILESIAQIGAACGASARAQVLADELRADFARVERAVAGTPRPRVLVSVGRDYGSAKLEQVYIAGKESFYSELVRAAGGENAFQDAGFPYPAVSGEGLMQLNPDVILEIVPERPKGGVDTEALVAAWKALPDLTAVAHDRVYVLDGDYIAVPGPRIVRALDDIARKLHPEAKL